MNNLHIEVVSATVTILVIWFRTEAFVEYFSWTSFVREYLNDRKTRLDWSFLDHLSVKKPGFVTRLLTCAYCTGFWICLLMTLLFRAPFNSFCTSYILSLLVFSILKVR